MNQRQKKSQEYHEFRSFLKAHRYHPPGRYVCVGGLEDHDFDALLRGKLLRIWQWTWLHIKNAEEMELIQRNVILARKNLESCKKERQEAKQKRDELCMRKKYLLEALNKARMKEKSLLSNLNHLEKEEEDILKTRQEMNQKEILRFLYNQQNQQKTIKRMNKIDQIRQIVLDKNHNQMNNDTCTTIETNPIVELTKEYQELVQTTFPNRDLFDLQKTQYSDNDIQCLRQMGGKTLVRHLSDAITKSSTLMNEPEKERDVDMMTMKEEDKDEVAQSTTSTGTGSSYDALRQVQQLLEQNQKKHIERFFQTQKLYTNAKTKSIQIKQKLEWQKQQNPNQNPNPNPNHTMLVELEMELMAYETALQVISFAYDQMIQQVQATKHQKTELDRKLRLMATFDQRQEEIFARVKSLKHENQVLLRNIDRTQDELYRFLSDELKRNYVGKIDTKIDMWRKKTLEELRTFFDLPLEKLVSTSNTINNTSAVAYSDFYLHQIIDQSQGEQTQQQQQDDEEIQLNGIQKVFKALGVPKYGNWQTFIEKLKSISSNRLEDIQEFDQKLKIEAEKTNHLSISIQKSIAQTKKLMVQEEKEFLPVLNEILKTTKETKTQIIPALNQGIEDWYEQAAFSIHSSLEEEEMNVDD